MPLKAVTKSVKPLAGGFVAIVAGESGVGKTSVVASIAYNSKGQILQQQKEKDGKLYIRTPMLFVDLEYGATGKAIAWQPDKDLDPKRLWEMLLRIAAASARPPRPDGYVPIPLPDEDVVVLTRHVAWDTVDVLQRICYDTLPDYRDGRQKYGELLDKFGEWKTLIEKSGIGQWLIAHVRVDQPMTGQIEIARLAQDGKNVTATTAVRAVGGVGFQLFEVGRLDLVGQMNRKIRERAALELYVVFDPSRGKPALLTRPTMFNGALFRAKDRFGIFSKSIVHFAFNKDGLVVPTPLAPVLEACAVETEKEAKKPKPQPKSEPEPEPEPEQEAETEEKEQTPEQASKEEKPSEVISRRIVNGARAAGLTAPQIEERLSKTMKIARKTYMQKRDIDETVAFALAAMLEMKDPHEEQEQKAAKQPEKENPVDKDLDDLWGEVENES